MVDYTLKRSCQARGAGGSYELRVGFYLGRRNWGITTWVPGEISWACIGARLMRARHRISVRQLELVVWRGREPIRLCEALERVKSDSGACAAAAGGVAMSVQHLAEYMLRSILQ